MSVEHLRCVACEARYDLLQVRYACDCGALLAVARDFAPALDRAVLDERRRAATGLDASGVWAFREHVLVAPEAEIVSHPEGRTRLYRRDALSAWAGALRLSFKHEGENPTGSFKDRGMTVAVTQAKRLGAKIVGCASTGNTSSSLAAYAAQAGLKSVVFLPQGKVSSGKLAQTVAYGATCLAIAGDFDRALVLAQEAAAKHGVYLVNSVNPFRIEGQKTIIWELLQDLGWRAPDWIVVPAGNLGNTSAFGKALQEAKDFGWLQTLPRLVAVQAEGASPFFRSFQGGFSERHRMAADTVATAIRIGDPVNYERARRAIGLTHGMVESVTDQELMEAKGAIDRAGIGCEPASACTLAGVRKLVAAGVIAPHDEVACVLTGHILKDPDVVMGATFGADNLARIRHVADDAASLADAIRRV